MSTALQVPDDPSTTQPMVSLLAELRAQVAADHLVELEQLLPSRDAMPQCTPKEVNCFREKCLALTRKWERDGSIEAKSLAIQQMLAERGAPQAREYAAKLAAITPEAAVRMVERIQQEAALWRGRLALGLKRLAMLRQAALRWAPMRARIRQRRTARRGVRRPALMQSRRKKRHRHRSRRSSSSPDAPADLAGASARARLRRCGPLSRAPPSSAVRLPTPQSTTACARWERQAAATVDRRRQHRRLNQTGAQLQPPRAGPRPGGPAVMHIDRHFADPSYAPEAEPALALFRASRHAAVLAFCQWFNTCRPDADDLALEADSTARIFTGLADLVARSAAS